MFALARPVVVADCIFSPEGHDTVDDARLFFPTEEMEETEDLTEALPPLGLSGCSPSLTNEVDETFGM
jgi:hypothetical protein